MSLLLGKWCRKKWWWLSGGCLKWGKKRPFVGLHHKISFIGPWTTIKQKPLFTAAATDNTSNLTYFGLVLYNSEQQGLVHVPLPNGERQQSSVDVTVIVNTEE